MITTLSTKGQMVIPEALREQARFEPGDKFDLGFVNGLLVARKKVPITPAQARAMMLACREMPAMTSKDETEVASIIAESRRSRRK